MAKKTISTASAPAAVGPYSQAVEANGLLFVSGQIGLDPATGQLVEGGVTAQADRVLDNLGAILEAAGLGCEDLVKCTVLLADMGDFKAVNEIYAKRFPSDPPARAAFAVAGLPLGALIEIEAIALVR
jgi:2-iminobutanoate/2-iminopropanoate deaminase